MSVGETPPKQESLADGVHYRRREPEGGVGEVAAPRGRPEDLVEAIVHARRDDGAVGVLGRRPRVREVHRLRPADSALDPVGNVRLEELLRLLAAGVLVHQDVYRPDVAAAISDRLARRNNDANFAAKYDEALQRKVAAFEQDG